MCPDIREKLPVHSFGKAARPYVLVVDGLVGRPLQLTRSDLDGLPQDDLTDDFTCVEGWTVPALKWNGGALQTILSLAGATAEAQWIQASAGPFSVPLAMHDAGRALIATHLGGQDLPIEHGGPVRLVVPGADCFTSVKWLDHLELRAEAGANTGREIALGRLRASKTSTS
jgi:DMSO/TMAO reductase YedYZ molybdopterin-dependent catalytic subunit